TLTINGINNSGIKELYQLTNFQVAPDISALNASVVTLPDPRTGIATSFLDVTAVCFVAGTRIATDRGDIAVENLREGSQVMTVAGTPRPVRWVGHRRIDLTSHKRPDGLYPVRIHAGAFADQLPKRDLLVSPDHCLFVDGQLVPAKLLINGMSIAQDRSLHTVHYYHVELDTHDALLAEGLPAETYLDTGNRGFFANSGHPADLHPALDLDENRLRWQEQLYAPLCLRSTDIESLWARLASRAEALDYVRPGMVVTGDPGLKLLAQGRQFKPVAQGIDRYTFILPRGASEIRVISRSSVPADVTPKADDWRRLGIAVRTILVRSTTGEQIHVPADDPSLTDGWHSAETGADGPWRWTDGDAAVRLPVLSGITTVELRLAGPAIYRVDPAIPESLVA
ncbi:MAG TPA: Hint domain-containing protein, partial [Acetobacteraceae bacterium]